MGAWIPNIHIWNPFGLVWNIDMVPKLNQFTGIQDGGLWSVFELLGCCILFYLVSMLLSTNQILSVFGIQAPTVAACSPPPLSAKACTVVQLTWSWCILSKVGATWKYSWGPISKHLNPEHFRLNKLLVIQMLAQYSAHHLCYRSKFKLWSEYHTKFSPVFKWQFKYKTIWQSNKFWPFKYQTSPVFRSLLNSLELNNSPSEPFNYRTGSLFWSSL